MNPIDLTTAQNVADYLDPLNLATAPAAELRNIALLITSASEYFLWRTGRGPQSGAFPAASPFVSPQSYTDTYDGTGTNRLPLKNWPIQSVASVQIGVVQIPASFGPSSPGWYIDATQKYLNIRLGLGPIGTVSFPSLPMAWQGLQGNGPNWGSGHPRDIQNVLVSYTAGFPEIIVTEEFDSVPNTAPYWITPDMIWEADSGVSYAAGGALTKVLGAPTTGQYYVNASGATVGGAFIPGGTYLFAAGDAGKAILLNYTGAGTPPDIVEKVTKLAAINYQRRGWLDVASKSMANGAGTIRFRDWAEPPDVCACIEYYQRRVA